jgi:hypothetical protein
MCCSAAIVQLKASHELEENVSVQATRIFRQKLSAIPELNFPWPI